MNIWDYFQALDKVIKRLVYSVLVIVVYALLGFFLAPYVLQPVIVDNVSSKLDRDVRLESIKINPFSLSATLNGFSVAGKHTSQLVGFEKLYVNFQAISLFKKVIAFDEISIVRPQVKIMLLSSGDYNFQDILNKFNAEDKSESRKSESSEGWPFAVDKFRYVEGTVHFSDENRVTPFYSQLEDISISLDDFSTRPGDGNVHQIKAESLRGTTVDWKGEFSLSPLKSSGQIELSGNLSVVSDYMQDQMLVKIQEGGLNLKTNYGFEFTEQNIKFNVSEMLASVDDLSVLRKEGDEKVLGWERLSLDLSELDLIDKKLLVNKLSMQGAFIAVNKDERSDIDFSDLFVLQNAIDDGEPEDVETSDSKWDIKISHIVNENSIFELNDKSVKPFVKHSIQLKSVVLDNLQPFTDELALLKTSLVVNNKGVVDINGKIQPASRLLDFDIAVKSVKLEDFQSYLNGVARIKILGGEIDSSLKVKVDALADEMSLLVQGDVGILSLKLRDKKLKEEFLNWNKLAVKDIKFKYPEQYLEISGIDIEKPYLRLIMDKGGETNIQKLAITKGTTGSANIEKTDSSTKHAFQAEIKKVNIRDGKMNFADNSLSPNFSAGIYGLKGDIRGLSSKQLSKAKVDLKG